MYLFAQVVLAPAALWAASSSIAPEESEATWLAVWAQRWHFAGPAAKPLALIQQVAEPDS